MDHCEILSVDFPKEQPGKIGVNPWRLKRDGRIEMTASRIKKKKIKGRDKKEACKKNKKQIRNLLNGKKAGFLETDDLKTIDYNNDVNLDDVATVDYNNNTHPNDLNKEVDRVDLKNTLATQKTTKEYFKNIKI